MIGSLFPPQPHNPASTVEFRAIYSGNIENKRFVVSENALQ